MEVEGKGCRCEEAVGSGNRGTFVARVCTYVHGKVGLMMGMWEGVLQRKRCTIEASTNSRMIACRRSGRPT